MKQLKLTQIISISLMLFAIFFGAGNMIFPPAMGQLAGSNYLAALVGFILTDAGIAILGITAVVLVGTSMSDLGNLVSKKFGLILSIVVYLLIGPLFALPRTGSVSFELAVLPFLGDNTSTFMYSVLFTFIFFAVTYYLSSNPKRIVEIVGKVLTPILLLSILAIFIGAMLNIHNENSSLVFNVMNTPIGDYETIPLFKGMIEGYNALDGPAGLAFAIIVINAIKGYGIKDKKSIAKYTILCGLGSAILLTLVYFMLTYVGAVTGGEFSNGGALLSAVSYHMFGNMGMIVLGIAVLFACLTTSIGLTTSFSDYFVTVFPNVSYKKIAAGVCTFSFIIANIGLNQLIEVSLPILIMIYPVTVVLCILSFFRKNIGNRRMVYILGMLFTFVVSFVSGCESAGLSLGIFSEYIMRLPLYDLSIGWIIPGILGSFIGYIPFLNKEQDVKVQ